jgi:hypothetical protein
MNEWTLNDTAITTPSGAASKELNSLRLPGPTELIQVMQHRSPLCPYLSRDLALSYQGQVLKRRKQTTIENPIRKWFRNVVIANDSTEGG